MKDKSEQMMEAGKEVWLTAVSTETEKEKPGICFKNILDESREIQKHSHYSRITENDI